jgi:hypothetical protein
MPGFLETTVYTGYGYLDPYVTPYVDKARNAVPLIDRAAKKGEEVVPSLITRVDEFTEPRIEKLRPIVEPRIEQVKEIATPYIDSSVKRYEVVKTTGCNYYSQTLEYKKSKVDQVQKIAEDKVSWCKKVLCKSTHQVNQLFRVPATDNLEGLKFQGVMGKMAALLQKTEGLVDKWMPALPKGAQAAPLESEYDDSYLLPRMFLLVVSVQTRLVHATTTKCDVTVKTGKAKFEKTKGDVKQQIAGVEKKVKAVVAPKIVQLKAIVEPKYVQLKSKVTPKVTALIKTKQYTQACEFACKGLTFSVQTCEKVIGKEKTKSLIQAVEMRIPASWKTAPPAPAKKTK